MPLDIVNFRGEEELKVVTASQESRFSNDEVEIPPEILGRDDVKEPIKMKLVDAVVAVDREWRSQQFKVEQGRAAIAANNKLIAEKAKKKEDFTPEKEQGARLVAANKALEEHVPKIDAFRQKLLNMVGNIVHPSVPVFKSEDFNTVLRTWGTPSMKRTNLHHHELLEMIDGYASQAGVAIAGHRAYFLKGAACMLNQALIQYGLSFLRKKGYLNIQPPFFMKEEMMARTAQLSEFDETLYKVEGDANVGKMYLIATSEQPISALHFEEWLQPADLPKRYAGISTCFRKEAGAHGKDAWGIFRVHQFEKVEQFVICDPEQSWNILEDMVATSEEFIRSLNIPYRVVSIVSGALNNAAAKKNDIEAWFPTLGVYRELVSCSNCTDYQSRAMETRFGSKKVNEAKKYVHMLNGTLCATERTICCILENYQTEKGIIVPEVLRKYMDDIEFIPFVKPKPDHIAGTMPQKNKKAAKQQ